MQQRCSPWDRPARRGCQCCEQDGDLQRLPGLPRRGGGHSLRTTPGAQRCVRRRRRAARWRRAAADARARRVQVWRKSKRVAEDASGSKGSAVVPGAYSKRNRSALDDITNEYILIPEQQDRMVTRSSLRAAQAQAAQVGPAAPATSCPRALRRVAAASSRFALRRRRAKACRSRGSARRRRATSTTDRAALSSSTLPRTASRRLGRPRRGG